MSRQRGVILPVRNKQQHLGDEDSERFVARRKTPAPSERRDSGAISNVSAPLPGEQLGVTIPGLSAGMQTRSRLRKGNPWYSLQPPEDEAFIKESFSGKWRKQTVLHQHLSPNPSSRNQFLEPVPRGRPSLIATVSRLQTTRGNASSPGSKDSSSFLCRKVPHPSVQPRISRAGTPPLAELSRW